jgi:predicted  nucleic acid-binding Zn-ribbon protein
MTDELRRLWVVRELDERAVQLQAALDRFPEERREAEERVRVERGRLEEHKSRAGVMQKARRELEQQAEALGEQERKFLGQLPQVKKNEEYQALLHEIADRKNKRSELETAILFKLEEEEGAARGRPALEQGLRAIEREVAERQASIDREEAADREKIAELDRARERELSEVSAATRSRYERVRASRHGRAVVPIVKNACGGCFRGQPPQVLQEARRGDRLLSCDGCGRLLIWPPDEA